MRTATATSVMKPIVLFMFVAFALSGLSQEKRITREELPVLVRETADKQAEGATIRGYTKEVENGQVEFEVQLLTGGHTKDVSIAPDGRVLEVEEQVEIGSLREDVKSGLQSAAKSGKITKVESISKNGNLVAYEAKVVIGGRHSEVQVGPDGQRLNHEE
jgi:hypothetical protein